MSKSWWNGSRKSLFGEVGGDLCGLVACPACDCGFGACDSVVSLEASFVSPESDSFVSSSTAVSDASGPGEDVGPSVIGGEAGRVNNEELESKEMSASPNHTGIARHCNAVEKQVEGLLWARFGIRQEVGANGVGVFLCLWGSSHVLEERSDGSCPESKKQNKENGIVREASLRVVAVPGVFPCTWMTLAWKLSPLRLRGLRWRMKEYNARKREKKEMCSSEKK